jgi:hypothetical protein
MTKLKTAEKAVAYIANNSKTMTASCNGDEVTLETELGEFTLCQSDVKYLADRFDHEHSWYRYMTLPDLAKTCYEELEKGIRKREPEHLDNASEGMKYLSERLPRELRKTFRAGTIFESTGWRHFHEDETFISFVKRVNPNISKENITAIVEYIFDSRDRYVDDGDVDEVLKSILPTIR